MRRRHLHIIMSNIVIIIHLFWHQQTFFLQLLQFKLLLVVSTFSRCRILENWVYSYSTWWSKMITKHDFHFRWLENSVIKDGIFWGKMKFFRIFIPKAFFTLFTYAVKKILPNNPTGWVKSLKNAFGVKYWTKIHLPQKGAILIEIWKAAWISLFSTIFKWNPYNEIN